MGGFGFLRIEEVSEGKMPKFLPCSESRGLCLSCFHTHDTQKGAAGGPCRYFIDVKAEARAHTHTVSGRRD